MKNILAILLFIVLAPLVSHAATHETISRGFWQDSTVWVGGVVPDTTSSDTFIINHPIVLESDLTLESGAFISINTNGGICGHQIATVLSGGRLEVSGILELDELYVDGGSVRIFEGNVKLTTFAQIKGLGGNLKVEEEANLVVGEWFECLLPDYAFAVEQTADISDSPKTYSISVHPNPFTNSISIENIKSSVVNVSVFDLLGNEVLSSQFYSSRNETLNLSFLNDGIYILTVVDKDEVYSTRIVKN